MRGLPLFLLLLLVSACGESKARTAAPAAASGPILVTVATVGRQDVALFTESVGSTAGYIDAEIRARVKGFLQTQKYKDGARVKEGQLLFSIEPAEYRTALAQAEANLARAETTREHARSLLERKQGLIKARVVSEQELEDAVASAHDADNQVAAARAQRQQAELNYSYTQIRSPISGVAGLALVRLGNLVGQDGPTLLTTVSELDPIRVNFPLSEVDYVKAAARFRQLDKRDLAWVRRQFALLEGGGGRGGPDRSRKTTEEEDPGVELVLADGKVYPHRGLVVSANRQVDAGTGTIQLQALFPNPDGLIRPGQYARVRMRRGDAGGDALVVPESALIQLQGTTSLAVVGPDSKVRLRRVEVGPNAGALRIVTGGVKAGERVVVEGLQKVNDGTLVNAQPMAAPPPASASAPAPATATAGGGTSPGAR
jgi:membrane fusion protein (multidrug efflux system)